jgi:hypothetical protein
MSLDTLGPNQLTLTRPTDPRDPNGIAHATNSTDTGDGAATKASRAAAKIAWSRYVQDFRQAVIVGDSSGPPEFPDGSEIVYFNEGSSVVIDNLVVHLDAGNTDSYSGTGTTWTNLVDDTDYTISNGTFDSGNGGSIVFNGTSTVVPIGTPLSAGTNYTKEAWVYDDGPGQNSRNILSTEDDVLFVTDVNVLYGGVGGSFKQVDTGSLAQDVWRHICLTFNDTTNTMVLYVNAGNINSSSNNSVTQSYSGNTLRIGSHFSGGSPVSFWNGKIAQVRVYDAALTEAQVIANYNATKTRYGL